MSTLKTVMDVGIGLAIAYFVKLTADIYLRYKGGLAKLGSCPGKRRLWIRPFHTAALAVASFFPPKGWMAHYTAKFSPYASEGSTILSSVVVWSGTPLFWLADAEAIKTVVSNRHKFRKEVEVYDVLEIYGKNVVSTEGEEWRRHIAIAGPAFNDANYALAWKETARVVHEWFEDLDCDDQISLGKAIDVRAAMTRATLLIISAAGFGMRSSWASVDLKRESNSPSSTTNNMPFHAALVLTVQRLFVKVLTPNFAYSLPFRLPWLSRQLEEARDAFASLKLHMQDLVVAARNSDTGDADLLRRFVKANEAARTARGPEAKGTLSDEELFSNIFVFLLAGHETSAHTLSFAIMLLALYPRVQRDLRDEVLRVWPSLDDCIRSGREDFNKLEYTLAVFRETPRCFPAKPRINKVVEEDTILKGTRFYARDIQHPSEASYDGRDTNVRFKHWSKDSFDVHIPKGGAVSLDIWALHMNPLYWGDDAHLFKPERFIDTHDHKWPRDAYLPFSGGARGCIGKMFAMTESICFLACLVRRYEILPPEGVDVDNLTESDKRILLAWRAGVTLTPTNAFGRLRRYSTN